MAYRNINYEKTRTFCEHVFKGYGFSEEESRIITDVFLFADLCGIESHGMQRLNRYHYEITSGMVNVHAVPVIVKETPVSAVIDGNDAMGQLMGVKAMQLAIEKAKKSGIGIVSVRNSNHYGCAGYYANMAMREGMIGISMTNTESIMVPTFGKKAMIGTNPIAFSIPADPIPFTFDSATTVVPRGKLEVYAKRDGKIRNGWAVDENGQESTDAERVLNNIIGKLGGGILPLGGAGEENSGYKGYGLGMIVSIMTGILSGGATDNYVYKTGHGSGIAHFFMAIDLDLFGDKEEVRKRVSTFMQEVRDSDKADGQDHIYTHGEKEFLAKDKILSEGIPVQEKTYEELKQIAEYTHSEEYLPELM